MPRHAGKGHAGFDAAKISMENRPEPYIGVSGVVNESLQRAIEHIADEAEVRTRRMLALGVKAVHKTQWLDIENKYGNAWYPVGEKGFREALHMSERVMGVAQAYIDTDFVDKTGYREAFVRRIFERGRRWLGGVQFDMLPWHTNPVILDYLLKVRQMDGAPDRVLLQCHARAMETLGPREATKRLGDYALSGAIDYVLFDASHGRGKRLEPENLRPFLDEAYSSGELARIGFGVAGGLDAQVVQNDLLPLIAAYPDLSWDAEGKLHPERNDGTRPLDIASVADYLLASAGVIGG